MKAILYVFSLLVSFQAFAAGDFRTYFTERNQVNAQGDMAVLQYYHQKISPSAYVIVNKKDKTATLIGEQGQTLSVENVRTYPGDEISKGGGGIYTYSGKKQDFYYGVAESDSSSHALFIGKLDLPARTRIYVLPETEEHRFRIRNHTVIFGAARVLKNRRGFNYSPANLNAHQSEFSIDFTDRFSKKYIQALQDDKAKLMGLLKIDNDEYNMLAEFAFGVLSPETQFGTNFKYRLKQSAPVIVSLLKGNGFDTDANSRGPTQIKRIPDVITENYHIDKSDLYKPENAAVTTLAFASEQIKELRNMVGAHPGITEETLQDYLYYLYNGRRSEIKNGTATPEKNISIQKIKEAIEHLHIEDLT